jgi:4-hydroxy-3-methylbut-2-enyl diphosphate reductase
VVRHLADPAGHDRRNGDLVRQCAGSPCRHTAATAADLARFVADSGEVVVIGGTEEGGHPTVGSVRDVGALDVDPARVCYLVSPGTVIEQAAPVIRALRARFPRIHGQHPDGFCYRTSDGAETTRAVAGA